MYQYHNAGKFFSSYLILVWLSLLPIVIAQPYGLDSRPPIGAFLNNNMPSAAQGTVGGWTTVLAFPSLTFEDPIFLTFEPGTSRLYVCERQGRIYFFQNNPDTTTKTLFLDISVRTQGYNDCGLLGFAFHPEFGQPTSPNRNYVYVYYSYSPSPILSPPSTTPSYNRLSRFTVGSGGLADPASELVLINQYDRHLWHNGGSLFFGLDGFLYLANGDEGDREDSFNQAQKLNSGLFSGVFRIDVNQDSSKSHPIRRQPLSGATPPAGWPATFTANYYIPNDNPFLDPGGSILEEYWALGLRSPHRMTHDLLTDRIWLGDVGQDLWEEISIIQRRGNYQWPYKEGLHTTFYTKPMPNPLIGDDRNAIYDYLHENGNNCVIGGYVYRGVEHAAALGGRYLFGDNISGRIWVMDYDGVNPPTVTLLCTMPAGSTGYSGLAGFGVDRNNEVYLCKLGRSANPGRIYKLARTGTQPPPPPALLSQTGAFASLATLTPVSGLIPYTVNSPLWSDAAVKQRWMAVPNDGAPYSASEVISFAPTGEWAFPNGSVFVKHFELPVDDTNPNIRRRLETRFLVRENGGAVYGVTYKWRADNSDADLLSESLTEDIQITTATGTRIQQWYYPSPNDCLLCHTDTSEHILGVKTRQLNGNFTYPSTGRTDNQLRTLNHVGLFSPVLNEANIPGYSKLVAVGDTSASQEHRVRSYIDANCSHCHRPGGVPQANFDARYDTPLASQNIINGDVGNSLGISGARVVAPSSVPQSIMHVRMNSVGVPKMPPLAKNVIDSQAVTVLAAWINTLPPGSSPPGQASNPSPGNGATGVSVSAQLSWTAGSGASTHNVYFGTTPSPGSGQFKGNQAGTSYNPGALANSTTYYWRIDEVNAQGTTTGVVWSFTTAAGGGGGPSLTTSKATFAVNEPIGVNFSQASGDAQDWIGLYLPGAANDSMLSWYYTGGPNGGVPGLINGSLTFPVGLGSAGNYQARLFFNDTYTMQASVNFSVGSGPTPPGQASNASPGNGATGVSVSAQLSWTAGSGASTHNVYFGTTPSPGSGQFKGNQAGTSYNPGALANSTTYYWRIDEVNAQGTTTGVVWSFTTAAGGGGGPSLTTSKATFAVNEPIGVNFSQASGDAQDWIGLYLPGAANDSMLSWYYTGGPNGGVPGLINGSLTFPVGLGSAGNYQARLFFNDTYTMQASVNFSVGSGPTPPGQASNASPGNGATGVSVSAQLSWTAGSGASTHNVYFGTTPSPGSGQFKGNQAGTSYNPGALANSTTYYWRIDEVNAQGTTTGVVWSFTTAAGGGGGPSLTTSKATFAVNEPIGVNFSQASGDAQDWIGLYLPGAANDSMLSWYYTGGPNGGVPGLINGSLTFPVGLGSAGNYQARLFFNDTFTTQASVNFSVGSGPTPPGQASSPSPANLGTGVSVSAQLSWTAGSGASTHNVYFGTTSSPGSGQFKGNQAGTSYNPGALANSTTYYWRIDEVNAQGTTTGVVWRFTTGAAATTFSARIDFQPPTSTVFAGYTADGGAIYGSRGNGLTFGWNFNNASNTRDRNSSRSLDQRYDTLAIMQASGGATVWEIAVPNGTYTVFAVAGDASTFASVYRINVEGLLTVNGTPTSANRWISGSRTVTVNDGRLTVSNGSGANNNRICFIHIDPAVSGAALNSARSADVQSEHSPLIPDLRPFVIEPDFEGNVWLKVLDQPGNNAVVEASNDLHSWRPIAVLENRCGLQIVPDPEAFQHSQRFYRIVSPSLTPLPSR